MNTNFIKLKLINGDIEFYVNPISISAVEDNLSLKGGCQVHLFSGNSWHVAMSAAEVIGLIEKNKFYTIKNYQAEDASK